MNQSTHSHNYVDYFVKILILGNVVCACINYDS